MAMDSNAQSRFGYICHSAATFVSDCTAGMRAIRQISTSRRRCCVWITLLFLLCANLSTQQQQQQRHEKATAAPNTANSDSKAYEWDSWDYYQLLGLAPSLQQQKQNESSHQLMSRRRRVQERAKVQIEDIKKAYRKQAQLWHPDKMASKRQQQQQQQQQQQVVSENKNSSSVFSLEESNARFARIAQAYEVLSNQDQRAEYDTFLLHQEDERHEQWKRQQQQQQQEQQEQNLYHSHGDSSSSTRSTTTTDSSYTSLFYTDPWALFEDFFFGSSSRPNTYFDSSEYDEHSYLHKDSSYSYPYPSPPPNTSNQRRIEPTRVSESTQVRYDAHLGAYVHRVLHREEYDPTATPKNNNAPSTTYFRVIGQEFIEEFHPLYGYSLGYTPISDPYLVEEGYIPIMEHIHPIQEHSFSKPPHSRRKRLGQTSSILSSNQYISIQNAQYLRSENQCYYAGLTPDCELVVMYDKAYETNKTMIDDVLVWTSESYIPYSYLQTHGGSCFLALYEGQLAVVVGENPDEPISILWSSPKPIGNKDDDEVDYYVSLDNDGSLVVYRRRIRRKRKSSDSLQDPEDIPQKGGPNDKSNFKEGETEETFVHREHSTNTTLDEISSNSFLESIQGHWKKWWLRVIQTTKRASRIPPKTHAARAWKSMQRWAIKTLTGQSVGSSNRPPDDYSSSDKSTSRNKGKPKVQNDTKHVIDECIFASSPAGCITSGRLVIQASKNVKRSIGKTLGNLDTAWEKFIVSITDRFEDDDDDLLDTMMRLLDKVGNEVGKAGIKIAREGMSGFHRVAKATQEAFQKSGWKEESEWTEDNEF